MRRTTAVVILLLGLLLFMGSCVPAGYVLYHEVVVEPSDSIPLSGPDVSTTATFHSRPGTLARFTIAADITTSSVQEDPDSFNESYLARFRFPLSYSITGSSGRLLAQDDVTLAWKDGGNVWKNSEQTTSTGGTLRASTSLGKYTVPADGRIDIQITLGPDTTYTAGYSSAQLHIYEGMIDNTWYVVTAVVMLLAGTVMASIGFILVLTQAARGASTSGIQGDAKPGREPEIRQNAMIIQLSAFAGYFIPFGNIILPVILWLIWRQDDPYLDRMGSEAVNFQLSMIIYYFICIVLMFVLIGFLLIFAAVIYHITFIIIGAVQVSRGADYHYPMTIRFIRTP